MFLRDIQDHSHGQDLDDLLRISKNPEHLVNAYKEVRKEVHVLSSLESPYFAELLGVKTSPYTCILLELAPKGSLNSILREYGHEDAALHPITLKCTALQASQELILLCMDMLAMVNFSIDC